MLATPFEFFLPPPPTTESATPLLFVYFSRAPLPLPFLLPSNISLLLLALPTQFPLSPVLGGTGVKGGVLRSLRLPDAQALMVIGDRSIVHAGTHATITSRLVI